STSDCAGAACGIVVLNTSAQSGSTGSPGPTFGKPTCAKIVSATANNCIVVPKGALQTITVPNWSTIQATLFRAEGFGLDMTNHRNVVSGRGQFFVKARAP